jgi:hypothetical protein
MEALELAGVAVNESIGVTVNERVALARDGSVFGTRVMPQILTASGRLYNVLKAAFPSERYRNGKHLASFEHGEERIVAVATPYAVRAGQDSGISQLAQRFPPVEPRSRDNECRSVTFVMQIRALQHAQIVRFSICGGGAEQDPVN